MFTKKGGISMKKDLAVIVFVLLLAVFSFSKTLTLWTIYGETTTEYKKLVEYTKEYTTKTKINIDIVPVTDLTDFDTKLRVAAPSGQGPDIIATAPHDGIGRWAEMQLLMKLDGQVDEKILNSFTSSSIQGVTYKGHIYGFPLSVESIGMVYNKDLISTPPKDWNEIIDLSKNLKSKGLYGIVFPAVEPYHSYAIIRGFGGYIFSWENGEYVVDNIGLNNEGTIEAIKFIKKLFDDGILPIELMDRTATHSLSTGSFEEGKAAIQLNGPWVLPGLKERGVNYGVSKIPVLPNGQDPKPFMGIQFVGINNFSKNKKEALDFALFLTSKEKMIDFSLSTDRVPTRIDVINDPAIQSNEIIKGWAEQAIVAEPMPNIPEMNVVWTAWADALPLMYSGKQPIEETLNDLVEIIREKILILQK